MRVDLGAAAAVEQDARVAHDGAAPVVLVLHRGRGWQETVEILRDVCGAVAIKDVVDDVPWFQRALQNGDVSLGIQEPQDALPAPPGEGGGGGGKKKYTFIYVETFEGQHMVQRDQV